MSARIAGPSLSAGKASVSRAASGTRSSKRRRRSASAARRQKRSGRPALSARGSVGRFQSRAARRHRNRRTRSGRGGRIRAGFGDADRRRARHRQVDAAHSGLRGGRAIGRARHLCLGRGIDRAGSSSRGPAGARRGAGATCGANLRRGHRGDARLGRRAEARGHRFDSDHVERRDRVGARNGEPGARLRAGADPLRQGERRGALARRTCHQGRPDRRPARRRAYGRRGLLLRGGQRARLPPAAGGQKPVRRDRRGRRFRNDRRRPRRSAESLGAVPGGSRRLRQPRRRGVRRRRGRAAAARRDSGARRADDARHAAPRGRRLGAEPAGDGAWPSSRRTAG